MAWLGTWAYRRELTIDSSVVDATLSQFPVPLLLNSTSGIGDDDVTSIFDEVGSESQKIAVTDDSGDTELYVEVEKWDDSGEEAVLHISRSGWEIASGSDTTIYIYYDNTQSDNTT